MDDAPLSHSHSRVRYCNSMLVRIPTETIRFVFLGTFYIIVKMSEVFLTTDQSFRLRMRGNREMSGGGGAVRNVMPLHPSLLSCNREELYGKLLRAAGDGSGPEIQINGLGREGGMGRLLFVKKSHAMHRLRDIQGEGSRLLKWEYEGRAEEEWKIETVGLLGTYLLG